MCRNMKDRMEMGMALHQYSIVLYAKFTVSPELSQEAGDDC